MSYSRNPSQGFMLLEAMIAMLIFILMAMGLISILNTTLMRSQAMPEKTCALWVAQNKLAQILIQQTPRNQLASKGQESQCNQKWEWTLTALDTPDPRIWQIRIDVFNHQRVEVTQYAFMPN